MRQLKIKTQRWKDGYKAWLEEEPKKKSTSTVSPGLAAQNLATRLFLGHNHYAQLDEAELKKITVSRFDANTYLATYDEGENHVI